MLARRILTALWLLSASALPALATFAISLVSSGTSPTWETFKIGAGGAIRGMDIQCDQGVGQCNATGTTTKIIRTDTYGAYWFNPATLNCGNAGATGCWQQIVNTNSIPGLSVPEAPSFSTSALGVYDIAVAPSNTQIFYMMFNGFVYVSTNRGAVWSKTALAQDTSNNPNEAAAGYNHRLAIDPANANAVIACGQTNGCSFTTNAGGSWTPITTSSIPAANTSFGYLVAFDPVNAGGVYICSYGHAVYHTSSYTGGTWVATTSSPSTCVNMIVDGNAIVWLVDDTYSSGGLGLGGLNKYNGSWSSALPNTDFLGSVAVNPNSLSRIYASNNEGELYVNTGSTWGSASSLNNVIATDITWIQAQQRAESNTIFNNMILFDPAQSNVMYAPAGLGVWFTNPPTTTGASSVTWIGQSAAVEQLVTDWIVSPNTNGATPVVAVQDQGIFINATPLTSYPSTAPAAGSVANHTGWGVDWCSSSPGTVVAKVSQVGLDNSGSYASGTYTPFTASPVTAGAGPTGGSIACSTPSVICTVGGTFAGATNQIVCSTNGGTSWTPASFTGTAPNNSGSGLCDGWGAPFFYTQTLIADRGNSNFYAYNAGNSPIAGGCVAGAAGIWRWAGSGSWANVLPGQFNSGNTNNSQMRAVPGQSGDFYFTAGQQGQPTPSNFPLYECTDTGSVSCAAVPHTKEIWSVGFGKAAAGKTYPAIYAVGWVSLDGDVTFNFGVYESDDHYTSWKNLGATPNNSFDIIVTVEGNNNVYGCAYVGFHGSGAAQSNLCP